MLNKTAIRQELVGIVESIKKAAKFDVDMSYLQDEGKLESAINKVAKAELANLILNEHSKYVNEQVKISQATNVVNENLKKEAVVGAILRKIDPRRFGSSGYANAVKEELANLVDKGNLTANIGRKTSPAATISQLYEAAGDRNLYPRSGADAVTDVVSFEQFMNNSMTPEVRAKLNALFPRHNMYDVGKPFMAARKGDPQRFDAHAQQYIRNLLESRGMHAGDPAYAALANGLDWGMPVAALGAGALAMPDDWKETIARETHNAFTPTAELTNKTQDEGLGYGPSMGLGALGGMTALELASLLTNGKLETNPLKVMGWGAAGAGVGGAMNAFSQGTPMKEASVAGDAVKAIAAGVGLGSVGAIGVSAATDDKKDDVKEIKNYTTPDGKKTHSGPYMDGNGKKHGTLASLVDLYIK